MTNPAETGEQPELDLLWEAGPIAAEVFGQDTPTNRRKMFHLAARGLLPVQKVGGRLCSSRRALRRAFAVALGESTAA